MDTQELASGSVSIRKLAAEALQQMEIAEYAASTVK